MLNKINVPLQFDPLLRGFLKTKTLNFINMDYKKRIKEKGLKQNHLAKSMGLSDSRFSQYLKGSRTMPEFVKDWLNEYLNK